MILLKIGVISLMSMTKQLPNPSTTTSKSSRTDQRLVKIHRKYSSIVNRASFHLIDNRFHENNNLHLLNFLTGQIIRALKNSNMLQIIVAVIIFDFCTTHLCTTEQRLKIIKVMKYPVYYLYHKS